MERVCTIGELAPRGCFGVEIELRVRNEYKSRHYSSEPREKEGERGKVNSKEAQDVF